MRILVQYRKEFLPYEFFVKEFRNKINRPTESEQFEVSNLVKVTAFASVLCLRRLGE